MRAAILREYGSPPEFGEFEDPRPSDGETVVDVLAGGLNPADISRASGNFYGGVPPVPSVVGMEGVGRLPDGTRVYFDSTVVPFGSFAERALIHDANAIEVPDGVDDALAVSLGIAGVAAWLALEHRARVREGETVVVLGATGVVGQVALQAARLLGAARVVAVARSAHGLARASALGADATVQIGATEDLEAAVREACEGGADVIVDPVWGEPLAAVLPVTNPEGRVVQLGQSAGATATIPSAVVRGRPLSIIGHTAFGLAPEIKRAAYTSLVRHAAAGDLRVDLERVPLADVSAAWQRQSTSPHRKLVIVP